MLRAMKTPSHLAVLLAAFAVVAASDEAKLGVQECADLGFSQDLRCATCTRLKEFLPSGEQTGAEASARLVSECQSCCQSGGDEVFKKALLYVCPSEINGNQDMEDFVKRKAEHFTGLEVRKVDGVRSTLMFLREGESEKEASERVNIRGWKSDEIRDFVAMKLGVPAPQSV